MEHHQFFKGARTDEWATPAWVFNPLNEQYKFKIDLAAQSYNAKCQEYYSQDHEWPKDSHCWLNPPFSKAAEFLQKCPGHKIVAIYKSANLETKLWQGIILPNADWVCFINRRVNYINQDGVQSNGVTFGSALIGFNVPIPEHSFGFIIKKNP